MKNEKLYFNSAQVFLIIGRFGHQKLKRFTLENDIQSRISTILLQLHEDKNTTAAFLKGEALYQSGQVQVLSQGALFFEIAVADKFNDFRLSFDFNEKLAGDCSCKSKEWCSHRIAAILQVNEILSLQEVTHSNEGKAYSRKGMVKRVLDERKAKARKATYSIVFSDNIYGEHLLINEKGVKYRITFRDFEKMEGYCSCHDYRRNKLGTCKHLIYAFGKARQRLGKKVISQPYPFVEIHADPLNDYRISLYYPDVLPQETQSLVAQYFGQENFIYPQRVKGFLGFIREAQNHKQLLIRPEVLDQVEAAFDSDLLKHKEESTRLDFSRINAELYPYQKEGVEFATFRKGAIIADEMGLGKTLQAIGAALFKKEIFGFERTLIICPASLKSQWKSEIEKFTSETAVIAEGFPEDREKIYRESDAYFLIVNYETILRDLVLLNELGFDLVILDEAQRIKNFETITANAIKSLRRNHSMVITGTPIENKLVDLYSIVDFVDSRMLSPLWEFSYQHCYFSKKGGDRITGYFNLQTLKEKLKPILIRREKSEVIDQLNKVTQHDIFVDMHPRQREYHTGFAQAIAAILAKKFKTTYDMQRLNMNLQSMRMACNSSFLIDKETHFSPKLVALEEILLQKLDLKNNNRKIIIFSEWTTMNQIIGKLLSKNSIIYTELNGKVPVKKRKLIIKEFEENPNCQVFLSTEAGGSGLNLQVADTVINFELPWNPAKKNQRIGRIDRLGQKNKNLTVINLITENSIELKIATGIAVKQSLFNNVLNAGDSEDEVDFSSKGRAQFLKQLEDAMAEFSDPLASEKEEEGVAEKEEFLPVQVELFEEAEAEREKETLETQQRIKKMEELEKVMSTGMEFLSGLFKMSTGKDLASKGSKIEVDRETGEVVMRFKMDF